MISMSDKAKQFLILTTKLLIVGAAFYFIYNQLANNDKLEWELFVQKFRKQSIIGIIFILLLSVLNRFFEILKWQNMVSSFRNITLSTATAQVLGALTAAIFTPNGIGEYGAKALFYEKTKAKKIILLNFVSNGIQMILSVFFGIVGLLYFNAMFNVITTKTVTVLFIICLVAVGTAFFIKNFTIRGYSIAKLIQKINEIPKHIHLKNILLGICRYVVFSHQYYFLFIAFDVNLPYFALMSAITSVYFLASSLPTFQFLDFAVRGSVAVYFFGLLGVNEWITIFITTLMWFLNVVLPVLIGSYYVLNFKTRTVV